MTRWGMVIDLRKCVGCQTCTISCKQTNNLPPGVFWRRVADCETGTYPNVERTFLPMGCMHCDEPPCLDVCPTEATYRRLDGIVDIKYDQCVGCAYCVVACPYMARTLIMKQKPYFAAGFTPPEQYMADPAREGVATKCTFCLSRLDQGLARGLRPGIDFAATPACAGSCISGALHFGDLDDPASNVSQVIQEHQTARLNEELGTGPGIYYILP